MEQNAIDSSLSHQQYDSSLTSKKTEHFKIDISFIFRASIGIILYSVVLFSPLFTSFARDYLILPILKIQSVSEYIQQLANGNAEQINTISNIFAQNIIYLLLIIIIVPLFLKEINMSFKWIIKHPLYLFVIPIGYLANIILTIIVTIFHVLLWGPIPVSENQQAIESMINSPIPWGSIFPIIFGAPIVEELIFRGAIAGLIYVALSFIFTTINKSNELTKPMKIAINICCVLVSATLFGLVHVITSGDFTSVTPYVVSGITLTTIFLLTKTNIVLAILTHMFMNTISYLLLILLSGLL